MRIDLLIFYFIGSTRSPFRVATGWVTTRENFGLRSRPDRDPQHYRKPLNNSAVLLVRRSLKGPHFRSYITAINLKHKGGEALQATPNLEPLSSKYAFNNQYN